MIGEKLVCAPKLVGLVASCHGFSVNISTMVSLVISRNIEAKIDQHFKIWTVQLDHKAALQSSVQADIVSLFGRRS